MQAENPGLKYKEQQETEEYGGALLRPYETPSCKRDIK